MLLNPSFNPSINCFILILLSQRYNNFYNYDYKLYLKMILIASIGFIALYCNYKLLSKYDANLVTALVHPLGIITTAILGSMYYNEKISLSRWLGIFIVCIGIFIIYGTK